MAHAVSAHVRPILLACARGEHQYVSEIQVEKERAAFYLAHSYPAQHGVESPLSASVRVSCSVGVVLAAFPVLWKTPSGGNYRCECVWQAVFCMEGCGCSVCLAFAEDPSHSAGRTWLRFTSGIIRKEE